jgi:hypothetical protein
VSYSTIEDLRSQLGGPVRTEPSAAYAAKMLHTLPQTETVKREGFILRQCKDKRVLEFGASGELHRAIVEVAALCVGVDRESTSSVIGFDLDTIGPDLPQVPCDVIICGEIIEHLSNPGWFLTRLKRQYPGVPVIITVPNAFSAAGARHIQRGIENVNLDHVAWYSPTTLATLLTKCGYKAGALYYYNGDGPTAEGLVVCAE